MCIDTISINNTYNSNNNNTNNNNTNNNGNTRAGPVERQRTMLSLVLL